MTNTTNGTHENPGVAEIEAEIADTREQLAATVDELTARFDVKARASARLQSVRAQATDDRGRPTPPVLGAAAVVLVVGAVLVGLTVRRRRR